MQIINGATRAGLQRDEARAAAERPSSRAKKEQPARGNRKASVKRRKPVLCLQGFP